jgi:transposase-like protein
VCRDLGEKLNVGPEMLRKWLRQARVGAGAMPEQTSAQLVEIRRLKKGVRVSSRGNSTLAASDGCLHRPDENWWYGMIKPKELSRKVT